MVMKSPRRMIMIVGDVVPIGPITEKKAPAHYVNNKEFFDALVDYRRLVLKQKQKVKKDRE